MDRTSSLAVVPTACASFTIVDSFTSLAPRSMWPTWSGFIPAASASCSSVHSFASRRRGQVES